MKKITRKQRAIDVQRTLKNRRCRSVRKTSGDSPHFKCHWRTCKEWIDSERKKGLSVSIDRKQRVCIFLPETMNYSNRYEETVQHITAIRLLAQQKSTPSAAYKLTSVNLDRLRKISSSAALVLTAELSRWDDSVRKKLKPTIAGWHPSIVKQFHELGFFELFRNNPFQDENLERSPNGISFVKYIKGRCGDTAMTRRLTSGIREIVGEKVDKWTFLKSGLDEAITNVSHHAYPDKTQTKEEDKNWYLTGAYNSATKELKIVFYDQGIGIPRSLPASERGEKILHKLASWDLPMVERRKHKTMLRAAVDLDRTSTGESDRGKGLQDLLEFIKNRKHGYLSIISLKGLYKFSIDASNPVPITKTDSFKRETQGTLIIWSVNL